MARRSHRRTKRAKRIGQWNVDVVRSLFTRSESVSESELKRRLALPFSEQVKLVLQEMVLEVNCTELFPRTDKALRHGQLFRQRLAEYREARARQDVDATCLAFGEIVRVWSVCIFDDQYAGLLRAHQRSERKSIISDERIAELVTQHPKRADVAAELGVSERTVRRRLKALPQVSAARRTSGKCPPRKKNIA
jgi:hypothetical protein